MTPTWSRKTRDAIAYLFRPLQDLDIYVEDTNDTVFYTELFRRIAPQGLTVARVFEAGGRTEVIAKARKHDFSARRALFLIDGDFEWVRGEPAPFPHRVYRLDAYCIENLLLHEDAAARVLIEEEVLSEEDAKAGLRFGEWMEDVTRNLLDLIIWFATLNAANASEATVGLGVGSVLTPSKKGIPPQLDTSKVANLLADTQARAAAAIGASKANELSESVRRRIESLPLPADVISGKDFLLPLFEYHLWGRMNRKTLRKSLRIRLARNCCLERFNALSEAMAKSARTRR
jgi:hypothetical protein